MQATIVRPRGRGVIYVNYIKLCKYILIWKKYRINKEKYFLLKGFYDTDLINGKPISDDETGQPWGDCSSKMRIWLVLNYAVSAHSRRYATGTISTLLAFCEGMHRPALDSPHKKWLVAKALKFILMLSCTSCWTSSRVVGGVRHNDAHVTSL